MGSPTLLIDAEMYLYQTAASCEKEVEWDENITTIFSHLGEMRSKFQALMSRLEKKFNTNDMVFAVSHKDNFRKALDPDYKAHRTARKPVGYGRLLDWLSSVAQVHIYSSLEADDVLGILATSGEYENPIIVSDDKDFFQIPGDLYRPRQDELFHVTPEMGVRYHYEQALVGDRADNYPGCPGIGEKRAAALLKNKPIDILWPTVLRTFHKAGKSTEFCILQLRLAKILQKQNYDHDRKEPVLWEPPVSNTASSADVTSVRPAQATQKPKNAKSSKTTLSESTPSEPLMMRTSLRSRSR